MKNLIKRSFFFVVLLFCFLPLRVAAKEDVIKDGIYAGEVALSGMNAEEARVAVETYLDTLGKIEITFIAAGGSEVKVAVSRLGISWENPELIEEALAVGTKGNVIERYKCIKDLQHDKLVYPLEISFDLQAIEDVLTMECAAYNVAKTDAGLTRRDGAFIYVAGQTGYSLDVKASVDKVNTFLSDEWNYEPCRIELVIVEEAYRGSEEELSKVKDVLGSFTTVYTSSGASRSSNIQNGCRLIDGSLVYPGEEFSSLEKVLPFTAANGYQEAGSYLNGKVVDSLGGGICQVTTTLYNAVLLAELQVTERYNHSMTISYVPLAMDAAVAQSANKDFRFVNNTDAPIYIEGHVKDKTITFQIYGQESRSKSRQIRYETEVREATPPAADVITPDGSHPIGYITVDGGYTGYKTTLWKVETENGTEVSRTQVNKSNYKMVPRTATVGTATDSPHAREEIMAAIGTADLEHVKKVIGILTAPSEE